MRYRTKLTFNAMFLTTLAMILAITSPTMAQRGGFQRMGGMRQLSEPEFVRRDLRLMIRELELDDDQRPIVQLLLLEYETSFIEKLAAMREQFTELRPRDEGWEKRREQRRELGSKMREVGQKLRAVREKATQAGKPIDESLLAEFEQHMTKLHEKMRELRPQFPQGAEAEQMFEEMSKISNHWRRQRQQLRLQFLGDLKAILTEQQLEYWPAFERALNREKLLPRGRFAGESVNLFILLRELDLTPLQMQQMDEVVLNYEIDLDRVLNARQEFLESSRTNIFQAVREGDIDLAVKTTKAESNSRLAVRKVNELFTDLISVELPEEFTAEFRDAFNRSAYARIYRKTQTQRAFKTAREFDDLEDATLAGIMALEEGYIAVLNQKNTQLVRATRENDPKRGEQMVQRIAAMMNGGGEFSRPENPVRDLYQQRRELNQKYRKQLEAMLTDQQIDALPQPEPERERSGNRWGRDRGRDRGRDGGRFRDGRDNFNRRRGAESSDGTGGSNRRFRGGPDGFGDMPQRERTPDSPTNKDDNPKS